MIKVAAAVIKFEDKVLLMRRAPSKKFPGFWEFPGGKVKDGERTSAALKRELNEELGIDMNIGKLITSAPFGEHEIYAYNVEYNGEEIELRVHDAMEWVTLNDALKYNLLPADKKVVMHMTNTKEQNHENQKQEPHFLDKHINKRISRPAFDQAKGKWVVVVTDHSKKQKIFEFQEQFKAMDFFINEACKILNPLFDVKQRQYQ